MKKSIIIIVILLIISILCFFLLNKKNEENGSDNMNESEFVSKINVIINEENYTATLEDNETSREFIKLLPLEINMNELNGNEKYYYFNSSLPSNSTRVGSIQNGDIMLYGTDCLVLFYESFNTSYSYTRIGKIDSPESLPNTVGNGSVKVTFTK